MSGIVAGTIPVMGRNGRVLQDMRGAKRQTPGRHEWRRFHASAKGYGNHGVSYNVEWDGGDRYMKSGSYFTHSQASNQHLITINSAGEYFVLVKIVWKWSTTSQLTGIIDTAITTELVTNGNASLQNGACTDYIHFNIPGPHTISGTPYHHVNSAAEDAKLSVLQTIIDRDADLLNNELYVRFTIESLTDGTMVLQDTESAITIIKLPRYWRL